MVVTWPAADTAGAPRRFGGTGGGAGGHRVPSHSGVDDFATHAGAPVAARLAVVRFGVRGRRGFKDPAQCAICYEPFQHLEEARALPCSSFTSCPSFFHGVCVRVWLSREGSCPLCRRHFSDLGPPRQPAVPIATGPVRASFSLTSGDSYVPATSTQAWLQFSNESEAPLQPSRESEASLQPSRESEAWLQLVRESEAWLGRIAEGRAAREGLSLHLDSGMGENPSVVAGAMVDVPRGYAPPHVMIDEADPFVSSRFQRSPRSDAPIALAADPIVLHGCPHTGSAMGTNAAGTGAPARDVRRCAKTDSGRLEIDDCAGALDHVSESREAAAVRSDAPRCTRDAAPRGHEAMNFRRDAALLRREASEVSPDVPRRVPDLGPATGETVALRADVHRRGRGRETAATWPATCGSCEGSVSRFGAQQQRYESSVGREVTIRHMANGAMGQSSSAPSLTRTSAAQAVSRIPWGNRKKSGPRTSRLLQQLRSRVAESPGDRTW